MRRSRRGALPLIPLIGTLLLAGSVDRAAAQSSFSRHEGGSLVLYMLLKDLGYRMQRITDIRQLDRKVDVLVVLGDVIPPLDSKVQRWVEGGRLLLFAPPLIDASYCGDVALSKIKVERELSMSRTEVRVPADPKLKIKAAACQAKLPQGGRALVASVKNRSRALVYDRPVGQGRLLLAAHADLLLNKHLNRDDLAVVLRRWLGQHSRPAATVAFLEHKRAGRFFDMLRRANLVPTALHSLVWLLVFFWVVGPRFGESRPAPDTQRRRFAQHARALGDLYLGSNASRHALRQQYERFVGRVMGTLPRASGSHEAKTNEQLAGKQRRAALARLVATRTGRQQSDVDSLLAQIEQAIEGDQPSDAREVQRHFRLSRALADLQRGSTARSGGTNRGRAQIRS